MRQTQDTINELGGSMIICDTREPRPNAQYPKRENIARLIEERGVGTKWEQLEVGDYLLQDADGYPVVVTRKASDLFESVFSGHFKDEIQKCVNLVNSSGGGRVFFLLEGPWATGSGGMGFYRKAGPQYFRRVSAHHPAPATLPNLLVSLQSAGIFVVYTTSLPETADALVAIHRRALEGWPTGITKGLKRPELKWSDDSRVARLMALWPNLREDVAVALLERHQTIREVIRLSQEFPEILLQTHGLGAKGLQNLKSVVD